MPGPLALPKPVEVVASSDVEPVIVSQHALLARLRTEALALQREADELESRLVHEHVDPKASVWMALRLRAFLLGLRTEVENECESHVSWARAEADRARRGIRPGFDLSFVRAIGNSSAVWFDIDLPALERTSQPPIRWSSAPVASPVASPAPHAAPLPPLPVVPPAPAVVVTPLAAAVAVPASTTTAQPLPHEVVHAVDAPVAPEMEATTETVVSDADAAGHDAFWPSETRRWSRLRKRPSRAVTLQALAGVVVMLAAVVHFA
jgi:hypothetical protein